MELDRYRRLVKMLAAERKGEAVFNGSSEHAAVIVEHLFGAARKSVCILSGDLNAKVYGAPRVVERAKQFLGHSDRTINIIVEDVTFNASHPLIEEIGDDPNVRLFQVPPALSHRIGFHCMTADDDCFRYEQEKNSHAAVAAFGDGETTQHLNGLLTVIQAQCRELDKAAL